MIYFWVMNTLMRMQKVSPQNWKKLMMTNGQYNKNIQTMKLSSLSSRNVNGLTPVMHKDLWSTYLRNCCNFIRNLSTSHVVQSPTSTSNRDREKMKNYMAGIVFAIFSITALFNYATLEYHQDYVIIPKNDENEQGK